MAQRLPEPRNSSACRSKDARASGITRIAIEGYKSLRGSLEIAIAPLTVLAGVNSSGKSSAIQPLLLLKQTLEAPYDPGPLLLDGPNVSATRIEQLLSRGGPSESDASFFSVQIQTRRNSPVKLSFGRGSSSDILLLGQTAEIAGRMVTLHEGMSDRELGDWVIHKIQEDHLRLITPSEAASQKWIVVRDKWSLDVELEVSQTDGPILGISLTPEIADLEREIGRIIHLPALRANPRRIYRTAAAEERFPGTFNEYTAGIISAWQNRSETDKLALLRAHLERLGLSWTVLARQLDDTSVELLVSRLPRPRDDDDLVNEHEYLTAAEEAERSLSSGLVAQLGAATGDVVG